MNQAATPLKPEDERFMALAIALGRRNLGLTWPNPSVGAVLVDPRDQLIISTGVTRPGGRPHAEPLALLAAGPAAQGATLYVSLEPCSHHGRTPPCTDAIVASGVARVVSALEDPDPRVAGRGHALLHRAGVRTRVGVLATEARHAHLGHVTRVAAGRPAVLLKLAQTRDGYAGRPHGRLIITGEVANARTHLARAHADAIMVGVSTVEADDPGLDVRLPGLEERSPVVVVLDGLLRISPNSRLVQRAEARRTWAFCTQNAPGELERSLRGKNVDVVRVPADPAGRVDLAAALQALAQRGITRVFCEGGPTLAESLAAHDLVDEMMLITNSRPLGAAGLPAIGSRLATVLCDEMAIVSEDVVGEDRIQMFERARCSPGS